MIQENALGSQPNPNFGHLLGAVHSSNAPHDFGAKMFFKLLGLSVLTVLMSSSRHIWPPGGAEEPHHETLQQD